ncbi:MAG TPA: CoA transferase [Ktedonosporobacter sp.]|jgi:crotonobetainyl-CoA:carnitine CoA-transferase CaiB-like acyl-CoA transferase|nr:CoA transferase [Ktedonosporobacter sp.]
MPAALAGIRVLDLTQIMAGPFCAMLLADLGAEVIKIENPRGGDDSRRMAPPYYNGESAAFIAMNRNKYGIAIDIRTPAGKEMLWRLIATADVLVENFRPGTMERLGFGFEAVHARHPALVYCSISGFGHTGPYSERGGFDLVAQAMSGVLSVTGSAEEPAKVGVPISDLNAGLYASHAILAALLSRTRTGEGQYIDTSLFEAALAYTIWESNEYWATGTAPQRLGTAHRLSAPYQVFATADGWIAIGAANQRNWELLVRALDRVDLLQQPQFATNADRMANLAELVETLTATLKTRATSAWLGILEEAGVPCGPVLTLDQVYQHPQVQARAMDIEVEHPIAGRIHAIGFPVKYSSTPPQLYRPAPVLGQHTTMILESLGYTPEQCRQFEADGSILDPHMERPDAQEDRQQ